MAYMHWLRGWDLEEARVSLTSNRPCSPRIESIRAATADLLSGGDPIDTTISMRKGHHHSIQVGAAAPCCVWPWAWAFWVVSSARPWWTSWPAHCLRVHSHWFTSSPHTRLPPLPPTHTHMYMQVAGLDFGWHKRMDLVENRSNHRMEIVRPLLPGSYPFKFIIDEHWTASMDYPQVAAGVGWRAF